ncbi:PP0621 family protein [Helicobacter sp. 12S02634-8]|uniref:PP0621 family protein n=1 Tax=Helicobacter sp. 12S02634-8 TaxID=1476199 RepID=UPI000BA673A6|nr:PP0621 family protein [Helicobacter sp. 12S02634-8]
MRLLIPLVIVGVVVWYFFLRKSPKKPKGKQDVEIMVECCECGTYISSQEAVLSGGRYFCSKKCLYHEGQQ